MIYRILVNEQVWERMETGGYARTDRKQLRGPSGELSDVMWHLQLPAAKRGHSDRARYYFTDYGWRTIGKQLAAEAKNRGYLVNVIRRKNPSKAELSYHDKFQVALLPRRGKR